MKNTKPFQFQQQKKLKGLMKIDKKSQKPCLKNYSLLIYGKLIIQSCR